MIFGGLHVISDRTLTGPDRLIDVLCAAAPFATAIHLREKDLPAAEQSALARELRQWLPPATRLIVNGPVEAAAEGDGIQVPFGTDLTAVRRILGPRHSIGVSVHAVGEAAQAEAAGADYVLLGTIFPSRSHPGEATGGLDRIRDTRKLVRLPIIAIGGVTSDNAAATRRAGADGIAVISAVLAAADPAEAADHLVRAFMSDTEIHVQLNGKPRTFAAPNSVGPIVDSLNIQRTIVAVELNGEIVPRDRWDATPVPDGSTMEVVRMIGGG